MTTVQIITLTIMSILFFISNFVNEKEKLAATLFRLITYAFLLVVVCYQLFQLDEFNKIHNCPQYEKIEDAYRLKPTS